MLAKHLLPRRLSGNRIGSILSVGLGLVALASGAGLAAEPDWPTAPYAYVVVDQDLRVLLAQFGGNVGVRIALSDAVQGHVHGRLPALPPRQFLDYLAKTYGLDWYYDGSAVTVSAASEAETCFVKLRDLGFDPLRRGLATAGLLDPRFGLRPGPAANVVLLSGPPRYVALVQQSIAAMEANGAAPQPTVTAASVSGATLHVFRGASASEVRFP